MTIPLSRVALGLALAVWCFTALGCLERTERIVIDPDGTVTMHLEFETKSYEELYEGDRVPTVDGGWLVEEQSTRNAEGDEVFTLVADAVFAPGVELPSSYEGPLEADPGLALTFPTSVSYESRGDAQLCHFYRRYESRPWAFLARAREGLETKLEELGIDDLETAEPAQQRALLELLAQHETLKYRTFARRAFRALLPEAPPDTWLAIRRAIMDSARALDVARIIEILAGDDEEVREKALAREADSLETAIFEAVRRTLAGHGQSGQANAFIRAFRWQIQHHEITQDLEDDAFTISVEMPGEVIDHNGDEQHGRTVTWRFGGESFRDHELELIATSYVR